MRPRGLCFQRGSMRQASPLYPYYQSTRDPVIHPYYSKSYTNTLPLLSCDKIPIMPFRCKCGRTFEKPDTFSSHTSSCALFHHRRVSSSSSPPSSPTLNNLASLDISLAQRFSSKPETSPNVDPSSTPSSPNDYPAFMPTALSIQNAFEGVRRRSLSYGASLK